MNLTTLEGNLTRDFEKKEIGSSTLYASSLAVNEKRKGEKYTFFINVQAWNKTGEWLDKTFSKGDRIRIFGKLDNQSWENADGKKAQRAVITINNFDWPAKTNDSQDEEKPFMGAQEPMSDDEIPF